MRRPRRQERRDGRKEEKKGEKKKQQEDGRNVISPLEEMFLYSLLYSFLSFFFFSSFPEVVFRLWPANQLEGEWVRGGMSVCIRLREGGGNVGKCGG